jgi:ribonuclease HI
MVPEEERKYVVTIVFDGGTRGGNPGVGYGSYRITHDFSADGIAGYTMKVNYRDLMTNNQAEFTTLISAVERVHCLLRAEPSMPLAEKVDLYILGDSLLTINGVSGKWEITNDKLKPLADEAREKIGRFRSAVLEWQPRDKSVAVLGH